MPGWQGVPPAELDGRSWTLDFAAGFLEIPEVLLREAVRFTGLSPAGTLNMRGYRSQGRAARAYKASQLITISENLKNLRETFREDS
jgi:hypothetical protein